MEQGSRLRRWIGVVGGIGGALALLAFVPRPPVAAVLQPAVQGFARDSLMCVEEVGEKHADSAGHTLGATPGDTVSAATRSAALKDCLRRLRAVRALGAEAQRLTQLHLLIPEFHDEQRFAVAGGEYGPMVMGFASPHLPGFVAAGQWAEHGSRGVLSAVLYLDPGDTAPTGPAYGRLGLRSGMNCLFLVRGSGATGAWSAYITWSPPDEPCASVPARQSLAVVRSQPLGPDAPIGDYPPVVRFTWDRDGLPLIGIRCLNAWCDIGPHDDAGNPAFQPVSAMATALAGNSALRAELTTILGDLKGVLVPGWHDEQRLSELRISGTDRTLVPGGTVATVIPVRRSYTAMGTLTSPTSRPDALIYVHRLPAGSRYAQPGWNLTPGLNRIYFRQTTPSTFYSTRTSDGTGPRWTHFIRHAHEDAAVISTARFRWASLDEGIWVACGQACCRVDGEY
jgi:hypothetical protein